ncbi:hypothetical protein [Robiginitalea sp.]|uniref:hypothetical protein n=1 Tax=Robiginitalea sp. TaxID=1902411 RepID=UPI003C73D27A
MKYYLLLLFIGLSMQCVIAQNQKTDNLSENDSPILTQEVSSNKNALFSYTTFIDLTRDKSIESQLEFKMHEFAEITINQPSNHDEHSTDWSRWTFIAAARLSQSELGE